MALSKWLQDEFVKAGDDPNYSMFSGDVLIPEDTLLYDELGHEIKAYEELELDPFVFSVLQKRKSAVSSREWAIDNSDPDNKDGDKAVELCRIALEGFNFDQLSYDLMNAVLVGRAFAEIIWKQKEISIEKGKKIKAWIPAETRARSASRFAFVRPAGDKIKANVEQVGGYELRHINRKNPVNGEPVPKFKIIPYCWGSKTGNPNGWGLGSKLWWPVKFKREVVKFWLIYLDRFSQPIPWGQYPAEASPDELVDFLSRIAGGSFAALAEGYKVDFLEAGSSAQESYQKFQDWCDSQISKAVLGETLTTTPQSTGGSNAATSTHDKVRIELAKADADLLSGYLREYLLKPIVALNLGYDVPVPNIWRNFDEAEDLDKVSSRDTALFQQGYRRTLDSVIEVYGQGYYDKEAADKEAEAAASSNEPSLEDILAGNTGDVPPEDQAATETPPPQEAVTPEPDPTAQEDVSQTDNQVQDVAEEVSA